MATRDDKHRVKVARSRRTRRAPVGAKLYKPSTGEQEPADLTPASEHYQREKARRANRSRPHDHPLEQARRAYQELLASDAAKMRGGRPRKVVTGKPPRAKHSRDESEET
jgi:hypothetical protein